MAFFPSVKQDFIAYRSSKVSYCIVEIHQLWQSGFSKVYSNCYCSCWFEREIIEIGRSSHKMYSNNIVNFQKSTIIINVPTKKSQETYRMHLVQIFEASFTQETEMKVKERKKLLVNWCTNTFSM